MTRLIRGSKGSSSASAAAEDPNSLLSTAEAKVLDGVSEGPISGLVNGLASIFLDDTPIANADGSQNFTNFTVDTRLGTQDQTYMSGFPDVESPVNVGVELTYDTPWTYFLQNVTLSAVRILFQLPAIQQQNTSTGAITGLTINYEIDLSTDGGAFQTVVTGSFSGKNNGEYERDVRIDLPAAATGWTVRVRRTTPNSTLTTVQDTTNIESITEIIDRKFRYPMTALVGLSFDATSFSSVPTRAYDIKGLLLQIPSNYDPDLRTYNGVWDGTFKTAWSNNPAWVYYDLVTNDRYGLGKRISPAQVDRWALYAIAQYCDVLVPDGKGGTGTEPRFTCNCYIQSQADAYKVLQDIAGLFRGISYWGAGAVSVGADMPSDPVYLYTPANVVEGKFTYVGAPLSTRYTTCLVTWNDPNNGYAQAVEYVEDQDGIAEYGVRKAQITAFGCTSQGQAHRLGLWSLLTSRYETNTVTFSVGLDGVLAAPGQVIAIADPNKAGARMGGRVKTATALAVTLDKAPTLAAGDTLRVILRDGVAQTRTVDSVDGDTVTVTQPYDSVPPVMAVWVAETAALAAQTFRVVGVQQGSDDDGQITYSISAAQYEPSKYAAIDNGAAIQVKPTTTVPSGAQAPVTGVTLSNYSIADQGISKTNMVISWTAAPGATSYLVSWRKDSGDWVALNPTGTTQVEVDGIYAGNYQARVYAVNPLGVTSVVAYSVLTALQGKTGAPPVLASLTATGIVFGIRLDWSFPAGTATDTKYVEFYYSSTPSFTDATPLGLFAYPTSTTTIQGLAAGAQLWFWGRLIDTTGNVGAFYPDQAGAGVQGTVSDSASEILTYLAGQIGAGQLAQDLVSQIDKIPTLESDLTGTQTALTEETQNRIDGDSALAQRITTIEAQYVSPAMAGDENSYAGSTTAYAGVYSEQSARADGDYANALAIQKLSVTFTTQLGNTTSTLTALVNSASQANADAVSAVASQIDTVQATADQANATAETASSAYADLNGKVSAAYTIRTQVTVDGVTYVAGIGLGIDNSSGTVQSQFLVQADEFAIIQPASSGTSVLTTPFVIVNGVTYLASAFIQDATITMAKIAGALQSDNYAAGISGWQFSRAGTIEINSTDGGGGRTTYTSAGTNVYDANGVNRVTLGRIA